MTKKTITAQVPEWKLQARVSTELSRKGILHHGDQNAGRRGPKAATMAKATGMKAGWPDLVVFPYYQKAVYFEFKTMSGKQSTAQKNVQALLEDRGFPYHVVYAETEDEAWTKVAKILFGNGL